VHASLHRPILKTVRTTAQMASSLLQATGGYGVPVPLILHEEIEMQPVTDDREQGSSGGASEVSQSLRNSGFGAYRVCRPIFCICMRYMPPYLRSWNVGAAQLRSSSAGA
jgi:hypothetical protein